MPKFTLSFPVTGHPDGRYMEFVTVDEDPPRGALITEILNRWGDFFPRTGTIEIYDGLSIASTCDFTFERPGLWTLDFRTVRDPRPSKNLRFMFSPD